MFWDLKKRENRSAEGTERERARKCEKKTHTHSCGVFHTNRKEHFEFSEKTSKAVQSTLVWARIKANLFIAPKLACILKRRRHWKRNAIFWIISCSWSGHLKNWSWQQRSRAYFENKKKAKSPVHATNSGTSFVSSIKCSKWNAHQNIKSWKMRPITGFPWK